MAEALSVQQLGIIARRYWLVVVVAVLLGAVAGYGGSRLIPPTYAATATQLVKGIPGTDATANYQAAQYAISRARTYPVLIDSQPVLEGVRTDFNGQFDIPELQEHLAASNPIDTPLVQVTAEAGSPDLARDLANSAAKHLSSYITQLEAVNGSSPVSVEVAVQATAPSSPTSPRPLLIAAIAAFALGCLALAIAVVNEVLVRPRRLAQRRERALRQSRERNASNTGGSAHDLPDEIIVDGPPEEINVDGPPDEITMDDLPEEINVDGPLDEVNAHDLPDEVSEPLAPEASSQTDDGEPDDTSQSEQDQQSARASA